jgi:hypothetical protein
MFVYAGLSFCRLQLLDLASAAILGSESCGTHDHIFPSQIVNYSKPGEPGPLVYIPQEQAGQAVPSRGHAVS